MLRLLPLPIVRLVGFDGRGVPRCRHIPRLVILDANSRLAERGPPGNEIAPTFLLVFLVAGYSETVYFDRC